MKKGFFAALPMYIFTLFFVAVPLIYLAALSFMERNGVWGVDRVFTADNYRRISDPAYYGTFIFSLKLSLITTFFTALIGYPFGYLMSRCESGRLRACMLFLVILPFCTNALVRIYGFIILLRGNGLLYSLLKLAGYGGEQLSFLYTQPAVVLSMVYALLPFMILTVYSSCSKLDPSVLEAARDLGASGFRVFLTITLPLTADGLLSGIMLVFIPSTGLFFISDLLGGGKIIILGNLIKNQIMTAHDYPFAAALSVVMLIMMLVCLGAARLLLKGGKRGETR